MDDDRRLELYQRKYKDELEFKEQLTGRMSLPYGMVLVLTGTYGYLISSGGTVTSGIFAYLYVSSLCILTSTLLLAVYWLVRAYWGYTYEYTPTSEKTEEYWGILQNHYSSYQERDELVSDAFRKFLITSHCEANARNSRLNEIRSSYLHKAFGALICAFVAAALAAVPVHRDRVTTALNCIRPLIVHESEVTTTNEQRQWGSESSNPSATPIPSTQSSTEGGLHTTAPTTPETSKR